MLNTMLNAYQPANKTPNRAVFFRSFDISRDDPPPAAAFVVVVARPPLVAAANDDVFPLCLAAADVGLARATASLDETIDASSVTDARPSVLLTLVDPTKVDDDDADDDDLPAVVKGFPLQGDFEEDVDENAQKHFFPTETTRDDDDGVVGFIVLLCVSRVTKANEKCRFYPFHFI